MVNNSGFTDYINRVFNPKIAKNREREIWHVLDEYHVSCDKELPQATAEVSNNDIVLTYSDNVSVEKIEVYVDGVLTQTVTLISKSGSLTIAKPSNTREDAQIAFKVYDCQGLNAQRLPSGRTDAYLLVEMQ